jgi:hypothetical protein
MVNVMRNWRKFKIWRDGLSTEHDPKKWETDQ